MIDIGEDLGEQELLNLNILLNSSLNGLTIEEIDLGIISKLKEDAGIHSKVIELVLNEVAEAIKAGGEDPRSIPVVLPTFSGIRNWLKEKRPAS